MLCAVIVSISRMPVFLVRICISLGLLLILGGAGCCPLRSIGSPSQPNVFVLRGIIGYWPLIETFEESLCREGIVPTDTVPKAWPWMADKIAEGRESGRLQGPLVIVGYSIGANEAIRACRRLDERGITVDKLVLLETNFHDEIPGNVRSCFNVYKSQPLTNWIPIFRGVPVTAVSSETELVNYDLRCQDADLCLWDNHLTLCANRYIQELMVAQVRDVMAGDSADACAECGFPAECR